MKLKEDKINKKIHKVFVSSDSKDVTVTIKVTDASGVTAKNDSYLSPDGFSATSITCDVMTLASGTNKDGTWSTTCTVPQGKASGNYYFSSSTFEDANGIGSVCYSRVTSGIYACDSTGTKLLLAVDNGQESDAPVLSDLSLSVSSVDVSFLRY